MKVRGTVCITVTAEPCIAYLADIKPASTMRGMTGLFDGGVPTLTVGAVVCITAAAVPCMTCLTPMKSTVTTQGVACLLKAGLVMSRVSNKGCGNSYTSDSTSHRPSAIVPEGYLYSDTSVLCLKTCVRQSKEATHMMSLWM